MAAGNIVQGALFTVMVVRAAMLHEAGFENDLSEQIALSPRFFENAPVVLDLRGVDDLTASAEFEAVKSKLRSLTLTVVGVQNAQPAQLDAAVKAGLASFAPTSGGGVPRGLAAPAASPPASVASPPAASAAPPASADPPPASKTRVVSEPVRSGTQIYARGADLIVTAAVSPGAELVADGNIHVYGVLRGRALAGAGGDVTARIFCSRFEAELVSIAGRYLISEQFPDAVRSTPVRIALVDEQLTITPN